MINRRRAPSSVVSSRKKRAGHKAEDVFADLIGGTTVGGVVKTDVVGPGGTKYSVKSGNKWQVFLYTYQRILYFQYLNIFSDCQEAYPEDKVKYFEDPSCS